MFGENTQQAGGGGLGGFIQDFGSGRDMYDPYFHWEPWDCPMPSPEVFRKAEEDGVDLVDDPAVQLAGMYPRKFQTGAVLSTKKYSVVQAGSQVGKSIISQVILGCVISRQPPYSLRFDEGEDTGIKRAITPMNIKRFGRRPAGLGVAGEGLVIDHDTKARVDGEWDCGNIIGAGKFPEEMFAPSGSQVWIGTVAQSVDTLWWPLFMGDGSSRFFPIDFIDTSKGNRGGNKSVSIVHCIRGIDVHFKTYEAGHMRLESKKAWMLFCDEEPYTKQIYLSGVDHAEYIRFTFTPLKGITWSRDVFFGCLERGRNNIGLAREDFDYFYATQYDSPYQNDEDVDTRRRSAAVWQRKSRIWGQYACEVGEPFFNRDLCLRWMKKFCHPYSLRRFVPRTPYEGITGSPYGGAGILETRIDARIEEEFDGRYVWRMYEDVKPGTAYLFIADPAEGSANPEDVGDWSFGMVVREPTPSEVLLGNQPVVVATTRSGLPNIAFARSCLPVMRYYNNAVLASERGRGRDNESFGMTLEEWPYWFYYISQSQDGGRTKRKKGFDTNSATRPAYFKMIEDIMRGYGENEDPNFRDSWLYQEMAEAIIKQTAAGKNRCDHPDRGSLDGVICYGIACYVLDNFRDQVVCNEVEESKRSPGIVGQALLPGVQASEYVPMGRIGSRRR